MKYFVVDTNIILNDAESVFILSEGGKNIIVLTETIIEELDKFKVGNAEINYQARKFNRLLSEGVVINKSPFTIKVQDTIITICENISNNKKPDIKIIETAINYLKDKDFKFITISHKTPCFSNGDIRLNNLDFSC